MFGTMNLGVFIAAGLLLNITPGADILYIVGRSAERGIKGGIIAALGIGTGCLFHIIFAAFGLSMILATSALAFTFVKLAGAAYLIYLGIVTLFSRKISAKSDMVESLAEVPLTYSRIFRQAILVNALNPKVALFFMAFLPQFVSPQAVHPAFTFLFLGCLFDWNGTIINMIFAVFSAKLADRFKRHMLLGRIFKTAVGSLFIGLGVRLAFTVRH